MSTTETWGRNRDERYWHRLLSATDDGFLTRCGNEVMRPRFGGEIRDVEVPPGTPCTECAPLPPTRKQLVL